jgi:hypothetical protein
MSSIKQNISTVSLSKAVSELLSSKNKNKSLGEASLELNDYIIKIKDLVDAGDITLEQLREEITKHLDSKEVIVPNSLAQLLIGCVGDKETCLLKPEKAEDVAFLYNTQKGKLQALSKINTIPLTEDSVAVLYLTGNPNKINLDSLKFLEEQGFKKLRIEYKDIKSANYKVINIDNLKRYIYSKPDDANIFHSVMILGFLLLLIFALYRIQN